MESSFDRLSDSLPVRTSVYVMGTLNQHVFPLIDFFFFTAAAILIELLDIHTARDLSLILRIL